MKPIRKIERVERPYFSCLIDEHRHQTEHIAQRCIETDQIQVATPEDMRLRWKHRRREMVLSLLEGRTSAQCATTYRISCYRVSQIFRKEVRAVQAWILQHGNNTSTFASTLSFEGWEDWRWHLAWCRKNQEFAHQVFSAYYKTHNTFTQT